MTAPVTLAQQWARDSVSGLWRAWTVAGAMLQAEPVDGGWQARVKPPAGLWPETDTLSAPMLSRELAQDWAERQAARHG